MLKYDKVCPLVWNSVSMSPAGEGRGLCCINLNPLKINNFDPENYVSMNIDQLKKIRLQMIRDEEPEECNFCFSQERRGGTSFRQHQVLNSNLKPEDLVEKYTKEDGSINLLPYKFWIKLDNNCQLACLMCSFKSSNKLYPEHYEINNNYLSQITKKGGKYITSLPEKSDPAFIEKIAQTVIEINKENKKAELIFAGGEPLINSGVISFQKNLLSHRINTNLIQNRYSTNGMKIRPEFKEIWNRYEKNHCAISLDGIGPVNEYIRFNSRWDIIKNNIEELKNLNIELAISSTIGAFNILNLIEIMEWMESSKVGGSCHLAWGWTTINAVPEHVMEDAISRIKSYEPKVYSVHFKEELLKILKYYEYDDSANKIFKEKFMRHEEFRGTNLKRCIPEVYNMIINQ